MESNTKPQKNRFKVSMKKAANAFSKAMPSLLGILLLIGVVQQLDISQLTVLFTNNPILDSFAGSFIGSIAAGNPITSYVIGGELLSKGVSLFAVTAFVLSWVTVGVVQFPAESVILGKRFALLRNICSFFLAVLVSVAVVLTLYAI